MSRRDRRISRFRPPREWRAQSASGRGFKQRKEEVVADLNAIGDAEQFASGVRPRQFQGAKIEVPASHARSLNTEADTLISCR